MTDHERTLVVASNLALAMVDYAVDLITGRMRQQAEEVRASLAAAAEAIKSGDIDRMATVFTAIRPKGYPLL